MNILLVAINAKYIHSNPAVFSLKSCVGKYESYVDIIEFTINQQPSYILREIYKKCPDVIAFSCYIWNRNMLDSIIPDLHDPGAAVGLAADFAGYGYMDRRPGGFL